MKREMIFCVVSAFFLCGSLASDTVAEVSASESQLKKAAVTLMSAGWDVSAVATVLEFSRSETARPQIKSRAMAIYALASLAKGDTNLFERARMSHVANFPSDAQFIKVTLRECVVSCNVCSGAGVIESANACTVCRNTGRCPKCNGSGKWQIQTARDTRVRNGPQESTINCNVCRGTGRCPTCNAVAVHRSPCTSCKSVGSFLQIPQARIQENSLKLLGEVVQFVEAEELFAERFAAAKAEPELLSRIRVLESLLKEVSDPSKRQKIETLLIADKAEQKKIDDEIRAQTQKIEKELSVLRMLKNAKNPKAAVVTLREYLAANPDSPHRLEVQTILDENIALIEKQKGRSRLLYGVGAILIVFFALSCVHISSIKYTVLPSASARGAKRHAPGLDKFTDPLSLTAADSKARVKRKTARIPPPGEAEGD